MAASKLNVKAGDKVLDVGCGVGGPLREIAAFTGAHITGLNNNAFQVKRGEEMNRATGRHDNCDFVKAAGRRARVCCVHVKDFE